MALRQAVVALALLLAGCTGPASVPAPVTPVTTSAPSAAATTAAVTATTPAAQPTASTMAVPMVGECTGPIDLSGASIAVLRTVSCDLPHYYEVQSSIPITATEHPGAAALADQAADACTDGFAAYVGAEPGYARYSSAYVVPDEVAWTQPANRVITCLVGSAEGGLVGSAKGDYRVFPKKGQCTGPQDVPALEVEILDCSQPHHYEVFAAATVKTKQAPTDAEVEKLFGEVCVAGFKKFVGIDAGRSKYEVTYFLAGADVWTKVADHRIVCSAGTPKGGIKGSLKGAKK